MLVQSNWSKQITSIAPQTLPNWWMCHFFFFFQCLSLNLSSNPDRVWVRTLFFFFLVSQIRIFFSPNALPAAANFPKRRKWSLSERRSNYGAVRHVLDVSVYSSSIIRLFLLIASAAQSISTLSHDCSDRWRAAASARFWSALCNRSEAKCYICWIPVWICCVCVWVYLLIKRKIDKYS